MYLMYATNAFAALDPSMNAINITSSNKLTFSGLQDLSKVMSFCSSITLKISVHGSFCAVDSGSSQSPVVLVLASSCSNHFNLIVSGTMNPSGS